MHFQVYAICEASCQQATVFIQHVEKIGVIGIVSWSAEGLQTVLCAVLWGLGRSRTSCLCFTVFSCRLNALLVVLTWKE